MQAGLTGKVTDEEAGGVKPRAYPWRVGNCQPLPLAPRSYDWANPPRLPAERAKTAAPMGAFKPQATGACHKEPTSAQGLGSGAIARDRSPASASVLNSASVALGPRASPPGRAAPSSVLHIGTRLPT